MNIITRAEWGARSPVRRSPVVWPEGVDLWIHHTDGAILSVRASDDEEAATVRAIQDFHMGPARGWNDIGYAYVVAPSGRVYEGRGHAIGAHSPGKNHEPSLAMLGTYDDVPPSDQIHVAVYQMLDELRAGDLRGHRENTATSCPGDAGMRKIVNGPPPIGFGEQPMNVRQRLVSMNYFSPNTIDTIIARLHAGRFGTIPNPNDSRTFRRARDAGFGIESARKIVRTLRRS